MKRAIIAAILSLTLLPRLASAAGPKPPPELLQLEREVSLKMAHARDEGFTEPSKLKTLADAQAIDAVQPRQRKRTSRMVLFSMIALNCRTSPQTGLPTSTFTLAPASSPALRGCWK